MELIDIRVAENFAQFEKEQDPTLVHAALDTIETAEREIPIGDTLARKRALSRRLNFFAALDRYIDPMWDSKDVPVRGVPAPPLAHDIVYSSGEVDPATIRDPEVRSRYVQALQSNKEDNQRYSVQHQLRSIDERALLFVERLLADSGVNRQELEGLLAGSPVSEVRKERLRDLLARRDTKE